MAEEKVVNTEATTTPVQEPTPEPKTEATPTPSGEVVKETPVKESSDKVPYSRFSEVIAQKNEAQRKVQEYEVKLRDYETKYRPHVQEESDPFAGLSPEEREQTQKFVNTFVKPDVKKEVLQEFAPYIKRMDMMIAKEQYIEAKEIADKAGINIEERMPEVIDYLSRPENKGRLRMREALLSLYGDEFMEKSRSQGRDELSQETKELNEKKKLANTQIPSVNPNSVIHSDEMARRQMSSPERLQADLKKAYDLAQQGVKNPKVRTE